MQVIHITKTKHIVIRKNVVKYKKHVYRSRKHGHVILRWEITKHGKITFGITMWYNGKWYVVTIYKNGKIRID